MNYDQFYFVIFIINALANFYKIGTCEVYRILTKAGAINNYLVKHYDVLSMLGKEYLINDLSEYVERRGLNFKHIEL